MSSWKNVVPRREHRERPQPEWRQKRGLLEKHKDYVQRAKNYHVKEKRISALRKRAADRNPDEFYFKMNSAGVKDGRHKDAEAEAAGNLSGDMLKLLKTQDHGYVATKEAAEESKIEKLSSQLHFLSDKPPNKHIIFVDSKEEADKFDAAKHFDTAPELVGRAYNRPRKSTLATTTVEGIADAAAGAGSADRKALKKARRKRDRAYDELDERIERAAKLRNVRERLETQKKLMGKGRRKKVKDSEGGKPAVFKWAKQRKR